MHRGMPLLVLAALAALCGCAATATAAAPAATPGIDWSLDAPGVDARCGPRVAQARAALHAIVAARSDERALADLLAIEEATAALEDDLAAERAAGAFAADPALAEAATRCAMAMAAFAADLAADPAVYAIARGALEQARDDDERQLARTYVEAGRRAGAGVEPRRRAELVRLRKQLAELEAAYVQAIFSDRSTIELDATDAAALPPAVLAGATRTARGWRVPVRLEGLDRFLRTMPSSDARRRYMEALYRVGGRANTRRLTRAVALRTRIARLLGFPDWAHYQLDARMAKTPARARALVDDIDRRLWPKARAEVDALAAMKRADGDARPFGAWDHAWYVERAAQRDHAVDSERVRRYFPADRVVPALLALYERLLGIRFERIEPTAAWSPDVLEYAIRDAASGERIAWIYLDLLPREGKSLMPATVAIRDGRRLGDGSYRLPVSSIIGNGPAAEPGQPALYDHRDLVTLFHEFGHLMHTTLSTARFARLYGTRVREDFAEAPSQMLENWMWQPSVLQAISAEVGSGAPIPPDLVARMVATLHATDGVFWTRQALLARFDLDLHGANAPRDPNRLWFALQRTLTPLPPLRGTLPAASFRPVMGGYDAGYYGYAWSRVYAQDLFSAFEDGHLDDPAVGLRYRREILEPGGSREPDELVRRFLGREPGPAAFYRLLGAGAAARVPSQTPSATSTKPGSIDGDSRSSSTSQPIAAVTGGIR